MKAGQLLIQVTGDTGPAAALLFFLGVPQEDNPFLAEIDAARAKLESYTNVRRRNRLQAIGKARQRSECAVDNFATSGAGMLFC